MSDNVAVTLRFLVGLLVVLTTAGCRIADYVRYNGVCYKSFTEPQTHDAARQTCAADGGILAMPKDEATNTFLASLADVVWGRWIGITRVNSNGEWVFQDGQTLTSSGYSSWLPGEPQPDNGNGGCVGFWEAGSFWDEKGCSYLRGCICQLNEATTTTATTTAPAVTTTIPAGTTTTPAGTTNTPAATTNTPAVTTNTPSITTVSTTRSSNDASIVTTTMSQPEDPTSPPPTASLTPSRLGEGGSAAANKGGAPGGAVAGGVTGAMVLVGAGIAIGGFLLYRKKKNVAVEPTPSERAESF
ncbi:uncharacterized protein LOC144903466 isoform X4 [Branchiostoma floridae x Branchiostoma belcheri]